MLAHHVPTGFTSRSAGPTDDPRETNLATWNAWAQLHRHTFAERIEALGRGVPTLTTVEQALVAPLAGKRVAHLQCHIGLDALSLRLLGASSVVGVDYSAPAVRIAAEIADSLRVDGVEFRCADVLALPDPLRDAFDVVLVNTGSLCWIPHIAAWARSVAACLRPGGTLALFEAHPLVLAADMARADELLAVRDDYFETPTPYRSVQTASYASTPGGVAYTTYEWNHGLAEVVAAVAAQGLVVTHLEELPFSTWRAFHWLERAPDGTWRAPPEHPAVPLSYALRAVRPAAP